MRFGEPLDDLLRGAGVPRRGPVRRLQELISRSSGRRDHDETLAGLGGDDLRDGFDRRRGRDRRPAELEDEWLAQRVALATAITSASIADAVASPPAPGPLQTSRSAMSDSSVMTFVGPEA